MERLIGFNNLLVLLLAVLVSTNVYSASDRTILPGKDVIAVLPNLLYEDHNRHHRLFIWDDGTYSIYFIEKGKFEHGIQKLSSRMELNNWPSNKELETVFNDPGDIHKSHLYYFIWTDGTFSIYDKHEYSFILNNEFSPGEDIEWKERGWPKDKKVAHVLPLLDAPDAGLIFVWDDDSVSILPNAGHFAHLATTMSERYYYMGWPMHKNLKEVLKLQDRPAEHILIWDDKSYTVYDAREVKFSEESDTYLGDKKEWEDSGWPRAMEVSDIMVNINKPQRQSIYANGKMQAQLDVWVKFTRPDPDKEWNDIPVCINDLAKQVTLFDKESAIKGEGSVIGYSDDSGAIGQHLGVTYSQHWIKHKNRNEYDSPFPDDQSESVSTQSTNSCANDGWSRTRLYITSTETDIQKNICAMVGGISSCDSMDEYGKITAKSATLRSIDDFRLSKTKLWGNSECHWCEAYRWELIPAKDFRVVKDETVPVNCKQKYMNQLGIFSESWRDFVLKKDGRASTFLSYPVGNGHLGGDSDTLRYWSLDYNKWRYRKNPRINTNNGRINFLELRGDRKFKGAGAFEGSHPDQCVPRKFENYSWLPDELKYRDNFGNEIIMSLDVDEKGWFSLDGEK